jgi:hypothetical protein
MLTVIVLAPENVKGAKSSHTVRETKVPLTDNIIPKQQEEIGACVVVDAEVLVVVASPPKLVVVAVIAITSGDGIKSVSHVYWLLTELVC